MRKSNYIYIVQSSSEKGFCKIGGTDDLDARLRQYNSTTGIAGQFTYLFSCEVKGNYRTIEEVIKNRFSQFRAHDKREMYLYNAAVFSDYVGFIKTHILFIREIFLKPDDKKKLVKIVKKTTPTLKERGKTRRDILQKAKQAPNDEFYTRYEDIEKEISMYPKSIWKDKAVFCNCDDAVGNTRTNNDSSAFALFFLRNFVELGLRKLICTHYSGQIDLFNQGVKGYVFTKDGFKEIKNIPKGYNGSFDDPLSVNILNEEADIVCTNPPFSRAKEYWKLLIDSEKKFLIISNFTNVKNHAYIPYFINEKVWAGYNRVDWFLNPKKEKVCVSGHWYCNLPIKNRPKYKNMKIAALRDIPDKYKRHDDSDVLVVDKNYIPKDYKKPFAVSVYPILSGVLEKGFKYARDTEYVPYVNGKRCFGRILIQKI